MNGRQMLYELHEALGDLLYENERLRAENAKLREYRRKYDEELQRGVEHGQQVMTGILNLALTPGVLEAVRANREQGEQS